MPTATWSSHSDLDDQGEEHEGDRVHSAAWALSPF